MSRVFVFVLIVFGIFLISVKAKQGYGPGEQDWGYVDVREGAHMFYWLYYTTATANYIDRPLAIWLQGGPGGSSTGIGNFLELGPIDHNGNDRNFTWVKDMNVLFIDNPVGSGFSYVDSEEYYTKNNTEIAWDLVSLMKGFYKNHPEFEAVPLHIFSQSYGGKMAPEFALELYYAVQRGELKSNLKSVGLGSPWTSPIDSVLSWGPVLLHAGIVDYDGYNEIMESANMTAEFVEDEEWTQATSQYESTQYKVSETSDSVDFYNILKPVSENDIPLWQIMQGPVTKAFSIPSSVKWGFQSRRVGMNPVSENDIPLGEIMQGPVTKALSIPSSVEWGSQSDDVREILSGDFMKPVIHVVEELLDKTDLEVFVYSGQLDLICATAGNVNWINKMQWSYRNKYDAATRSGIVVNDILEGYEKSAGKFTMFWINRAGHSIPADNPKGMGYVLRKITKILN